MTWYVTRNASGGIACAYQYQMDDLPTEALADDNAELVAFFASAHAPPVPASITRRQCARAMFMQGLITGPEALAMTQNGTPPALVETMLTAMPDDAEVLARIDFAADTYMRSNPLLVALMEGTGADAAAIDAFFIAAGAL